jgi:hypothetical protein
VLDAAARAAIMRRLYNWILHWLRWLFVSPWPFWICVIVIVAAGLFAWVCPWHDTESRMRWAGTALQLAGLVLTAVGILQTRALFHLPSPAAILRGWFAERPKWRTEARLEASTVGLTMRGFAPHLSKSPGADRPIDERIAWLVAQLDKLEQQIGVSLRQVTDAAAAQVSEERNARIAEDAEINKRLKLSATGGLNLSAVGLIWLVLGTVLAGFAPELAALP